MMVRRKISIPACMVMLFVLAAGSLRGATKLYLKDGSYQLVKSYEVKGDRVRYYSVERAEWEEIPTTLVDFAATKRAEQQDQAEKAQEIQQAKHLEKNHLTQTVFNGYQVAAGIHLPKDEGLFALDGSRVIPLAQSAGDMVRDKKRMALNMAVPAPLLKRQSLVVLAGPKAAIRIFATQPAFYAEFTDSTAANLQLIRLKATKQDRVVEKVDVGLKGRPTESRASIPLTRTHVAPGIDKLQPAQPLAPGEYAFGEVEDNKMNLDVWDFGIDRNP